MAILPQRCEQIIYSEPNSSYGEGLLVAKGNPKNIHDFESFASSGHKVAIMAGADQLEMMQALKVPMPAGLSPSPTTPTPSPPSAPAAPAPMPPPA